MVFMAAACSSGNNARPGDSALSPVAGDVPAVLQAVDGIPCWKRTGPLERYNKEGLYGYIDGGAEIVLQYGFRELSVSKFKPAGPSAAPKEIVLEIYRMSSGEAAFGLYSTKLEGGEGGWPGIKPDNWVGLGQANFVKGEFLVNILAPDCTDSEIGEFMAALERKVPGRGTARPRGLSWLPREGMVPSSWRYIKGPLAARNESPFLDGGFWGFAPSEPGGKGIGATEAFSAKYGAAPAVSKLVVVEFGKAVSPAAVEEGVLAAFSEYLQGVRREEAVVEGRTDAGRWFLFKRTGTVAVLVLGEPDEAAARTRLDAALALARSRPTSHP
jgi:hypothetical protein